MDLMTRIVSSHPHTRGPIVCADLRAVHFSAGSILYFVGCAGLYGSGAVDSVRGADRELRGVSDRLTKYAAIRRHAARNTIGAIFRMGVRTSTIEGAWSRLGARMACVRARASTRRARVVAAADRFEVSGTSEASLSLLLTSGDATLERSKVRATERVEALRYRIELKLDTLARRRPALDIDADTVAFARHARAEIVDGTVLAPIQSHDRRLEIGRRGDGSARECEGSEESERSATHGGYAFARWDAPSMWAASR